MRSLQNTLSSIALGGLVIALCYFFVDRAVAFYVHDQGISQHVVIKWLTFPPPIVQAWVPLVLAVLVVRRIWGPWRRWELAILAAGVGMVLADQFRESLSYIFGRYWPETWINNNPSLIQNGAYGFHPFHDGSNFGSFPSGHAARTCAVAAVVWMSYPRWRWVAVICSLPLCLALVAMNYHFVSDVFAGVLVGAIVGIYSAICCGLE